MRVISGSAGGHRLLVPQSGVRPTTDRTKSAIFSWLGDHVRGARALDLFAGAGGLGIEALSRDAAAVVFVESAAAVTAVLEKNLASTRLAERATVRTITAGQFLKSPPPAVPFDLIFCDPPWIEKGADSDWVGWILAQAELPAFLAPGGWFILEAPSGRRLDPGPLWECRDQRRYGTTTVYYLKPAAPPAGGGG